MANDYTGLLSGSYWGGIEVTGKPTIVTYSFPTSAPGYVTTLDDPNLTPAAIASYQGFSTAEQTMARQALAEWGDNSGLIFIEVAPGMGDINFQKLNFNGTGYAGAGGIAYRPFGDWQFSSYPYFTSDLDAAGDVFMNSAFPIVYGTLLHEIGHALGLKHPTEQVTNFAAEPDVTHAVWTTDDPNLTIMSQQGGGTGHLQAADIAAIQHIYGTNAQDGTQVASWSFNTAKQTLTQTGFATDDAIRGSSVKDVINGGDGNDKLFGLSGNDTLVGGNGNDLLDGGPGTDSMTGGMGDDTYFTTATGDKAIELANQGYDTVIAMGTSYTLGANVEQLQFWTGLKATGKGNASDNVIYAGSGGGTFSGLGGNDYIVGGNGVDVILGGDNDDQIYAEAGKDKITGGTGSDYMFGGSAADSFIFLTLGDFGPSGALDYIGDFSRTELDKIDLKKVDPDALLTGDQGFTFIGTAAFTVNAQYQLRYQVSGSDLLVQGDINHDTVADFAFLVHGVTSLIAKDFVL